MDAYCLAEKFRTVRNLRVPLTFLYNLANVYADTPADDPDLVAIIGALDEASKERKLSGAEAHQVWRLVELRREYGDYPEATLEQLGGLNFDEPWVADAVDALKKERPTDAEAADAIEVRSHLAYIASLYAEHGKLPDNLPVDWHTLHCLEDMEPEKRAAFLEKLNAAESLDEDSVADIAGDVRCGDRDPAEDEEPAEADEAEAPVREPPEVVQVNEPAPARRTPVQAEREDIGPESKSEAQRLQVRVDELQNAKRMLESKVLALESEVEELKDARCDECPHCGKSLAEKQAARRNGKHEEAVA
jgi:hypothetical protein